jgi:CHAT domain-containing protein
MGLGSTVVLSACNLGREEIRAEGVVGLARGFFFAVAAATVVSLWGVHDESTAGESIIQTPEGWPHGG